MFLIGDARLKDDDGAEAGVSFVFKRTTAIKLERMVELDPPQLFDDLELRLVRNVVRVCFEFELDESLFCTVVTKV